MPFTLPERELRFSATRSGGPGGQHVNRTATRVEVRWDVARSPSLSPAQRDLLLQRLASRIDSSGVLRIVCDEFRSQHRNRQAAVERLGTMVERALKRPKPRRPTKPPRAAVEKRLEGKRQRGARKQERRPVDPDER